MKEAVFCVLKLDETIANHPRYSGCSWVILELERLWPLASEIYFI